MGPFCSWRCHGHRELLAESLALVRAADPERGVIQQSWILARPGGNRVPVLKAVSAVPDWLGRADGNVTQRRKMLSKCICLFPIALCQSMKAGAAASPHPG